jgi:hypothetical protein
VHPLGGWLRGRSWSRRIEKRREKKMFYLVKYHNGFPVEVAKFASVKVRNSYIGKPCGHDGEKYWSAIGAGEAKRIKAELSAEREEAYRLLPEIRRARYGW